MLRLHTIYAHMYKKIKHYQNELNIQRGFQDFTKIFWLCIILKSTYLYFCSCINKLNSMFNSINNYLINNKRINIVYAK